MIGGCSFRSQDSCEVSVGRKFLAFIHFYLSVLVKKMTIQALYIVIAIFVIIILAGITILLWWRLRKHHAMTNLTSKPNWHINSKDIRLFEYDVNQNNTGGAAADSLSLYSQVRTCFSQQLKHGFKTSSGELKIWYRTWPMLLRGRGQFIGYAYSSNTQISVNIEKVLYSNFQYFYFDFFMLQYSLHS